MQPRKASIWWGPPRKYNTTPEDRKVSWLELFYDLVYVIAISTITHHLAAHPSASALIEYFFLFAMIYWGWLNGSLYHDVHGSPGIRTRLITLWQMMAVAALIVCLNSMPETLAHRSTIALMVIQAYITYLWWSVGFYDKTHRQYSSRYTSCYLAALALLTVMLFAEGWLAHALPWVVLVLNFLPPFLVVGRLRRNAEDFSLSTSMVERLGLFTIIMFGEGVLGVIQGIIKVEAATTEDWMNFGLGIIIVFALWWIFFSILADREGKRGVLTFQTICLAYIPTLAALGMVGAAFAGLFSGSDSRHASDAWSLGIFGSSLFVFLAGITFISRFLQYPDQYHKAAERIPVLLVLTGLSILLITFFWHDLSLHWYLILVTIPLLSIVVFITRTWYLAELSALTEESMDGES